jgi:hypothetical protein
MFLVIWQLARRGLAVGMSLCLALAYIGPSVAVACEGAGEETLPRLVNTKGEKLQRGFTIRSGRSVLMVTPRTGIVCTSDAVEGARQISLNGAEATRVVLRGCKLGTERCNSPRAGAEEIETGVVEFVLSFRPPGPPTTTDVLWFMQERGGGGGVFLTVTCGRETYRIKDGALGEVTPTGRRTKTLTAAFEQEEGKQKLTEYLNEKGEAVKDYFEAEGEGEEAIPLKEIGFSSTEELQFEEEVEIVT